jgi:phosphoglucomutase
VLTGFKWIAELIRKKEGEENYIIGGEESFGLMIGSRVRDKDGISAVALLCEMAAFEKDKGRSLYEKLIDLYVQYGLYREHLVSITKKGMDGQRQIGEMMEKFRKDPPAVLDGIPVTRLVDHSLQKGHDLQTGKEWNTGLPSSNVLQFILSDGSVISARPSGTEPKIKFYFSVNTALNKREDFESAYEELGKKIARISAELKLTN